MQKHGKEKRKAGIEGRRGREKNHPSLSCSCTGVVNSLFAVLLQLLIILLCRRCLKHFLGIENRFVFLEVNTVISVRGH